MEPQSHTLQYHQIQLENPVNLFPKNKKPKQRMMLYGKHSSEEEIVQEISRLLLGDSIRKYSPCSVTQVARMLGFSRKTIYNYIKKAVKKYHCLKYNTAGRLDIPKTSEDKFRKFDKMHPILEDPLVSEWRQDLLTRKGGEPLVSWRTRIRNMETICNTCQINPSQLLSSQRQTEKILKNYVELYRQKRHDRSNRGLKSHPDSLGSIYLKVQATRDFCSYYGITWRRGVNGIMSQKIVGHGKYADIRLSEQELEQAGHFIKEWFGLDSDIYRWFWIGIESCARFEALYSMNLDYTKHASKTDKTTYIMTAYESKTKYLRGGKWHKYITRPDTQKSIDLLKTRNGSRIYESRLAKDKFRAQISDELSQVYKSLGKTNPYFYHRPNHALRHIGAHYWLSKKDYNYGLVAEIGGWHTIDELKKSYGQIPPEKILELIEGD